MHHFRSASRRPFSGMSYYHRANAKSWTVVSPLTFTLSTLVPKAPGLLPASSDARV